jgi:very-short-patch-repair endonuclease
VLDFFCHRARLAIELDGAQHAEPEATERDTERDRFLEFQGVRVLRFADRDVLTRLRAVLEEILSMVERANPLP